MGRVQSLVCKEDGSEVVEFALTSTVFFALLLGIIEFGVCIYANNFVATAAQQGTRYAMVRGSDWTSACASTSSYGCAATTTNVQNYILSQPHGGINLVAADITVTQMTTNADGATCVANSKGCQVKVKISYPFQLNIPLLPASYSTVTLTSTSIETIQD